MNRQPGGLAQMIDVEEAQRILLDHIRPCPTQEVSLQDALFRTLAEPVRTDVDFPPFDRAVMDGYAVRANDTVNIPARLQIVGQVAAGTSPTTTLQPGQAMQINTGAPLPAGADAVVRVESTEADGSTVTVNKSVDGGTFVTRRAAYVTAGEEVIPAGTRMTALEVGAAATAGAAQVTVYRQPRVAVLVTGNELVDVDSRPGPGQIRDSNRYLLRGMLWSDHVEVLDLGVASDQRDVLESKVSEGLNADLLCITGGISMGAFDFVPEILRKVGAELLIQKLAIKPGRPTIFAVAADGTPILALPGNPGSALVGYVLMVRSALAGLEGRATRRSAYVSMRLDGVLSATSGRRSFLPGRVLIGDDGQTTVTPLHWHGSGDSFGWVHADVMIMSPPHSDKAVNGSMVSTLRIELP